MRFLKIALSVLGILLLGVAALAAFVVSKVEDIPPLDLINQVDTEILDDTFLPVIEKSQDVLIEARKKLNTPAISVAISVNGELIWAEARGVSDLQTLEPASTASKFIIGSVSKPITAAAAVRLAEAGLLDLDADVRTYAPRFPEKSHVITTRQLLSHQAGIRHYKFALNPPFFSESAMNEQFDTVDESLSIFADDDLLFEPNTSFQYSTYGYTLVSAAIEGASGQSFLDYLQTDIFDPIGMNRTSADYADRQIDQRVSDYVQTIYAEGKVLPAPSTNSSYKWAGGGLVSTPTDLVRFGNALLAAEIVSPDGLEEMFTARQVSSGETNPQHYGLGWRMGLLSYPKGSDTYFSMINHGGTSIGSITILMLMPENGIVIAMCANSTGSSGSGAIRSEAAAIVRLFIDHMTQGKPHTLS